MAAPFAVSILESIFNQTDLFLNYKKIMQGWESKEKLYKDWLKKRNQKRLSDTFFSNLISNKNTL